MHIHFICMGNSFRSITAEAYAKSLELDDLTFSSSGVVAKSSAGVNHKYHPVTAKKLEDEGLAQYKKVNWGEQTTQELLDKADLNVFVNNIAENTARKRGLNLRNYKTLNIDDVDEGENLKDPNRTHESVNDRMFPIICSQVDTLIEELK